MIYREAIRVESAIFAAFDMAKTGSVNMLSGPSENDPDGIGKAIDGVPRWRRLGLSSLFHFGPGDASYRLKPAGMVFMVPIYMLSALWLRDENLGLESLGDLFIPPLNPNWTRLRALTYGFESDDETMRDSVAGSVDAYRRFVAEFNQQERAAIADWLSYFATEIFPEFRGRSQLGEIQRFWQMGDSQLRTEKS